METLRKYSKRFAFFGSYLIAYLYICAFIVADFPREKLCFSLFTALFFVWGFCSFPQRFREIPKESFFWLTVAVSLTVAAIFERGNAVDGFLMLGLHAVAVYTLLCFAGVLRGETGFYSPWSLIFGMIVYPFGDFFMRLIQLWKGITATLKKATLKKTLTVLLAFLGALILLAAAILLLSSADPNFGKFFEPLLSFEIPDWMSKYFGYFCLSLPVGAFLYGLTYGIGKDLEKKEEIARKHARFEAGLSRAKVVEPVYLSALLGLFCILYLAFFSLQGSYLFGAFRGAPPQGFTVSSYARQGFFQLIAVGALNFLLLGCVYLFGQKNPKEHMLLRSVSLLLMLESFFFSVTALSKVFLYIRLYGFTPLRYSSFWACLVLMAGILLAVISFFKNIRGMQKWIFFAAATFAVLCFF